MKMDGAPPAPRTPIPFASSVVTLEDAESSTLHRAAALLFRIAHSASYRRQVDAGAPPTALQDPGNRAVLMGYDFHLTESGPRLIEIDTNAGGAPLNGLHTAELCDPRRFRSSRSGLVSAGEMEERVASAFGAELLGATKDVQTLGLYSVFEGHWASPVLICRQETRRIRPLALLCVSSEVPTPFGHRSP
jgi:hypothetical protein